MKIAYEHLISFFDDIPTIDEISARLFQLGHENEISDQIFDIEFTPNRGDCLSLNGISRDLGKFFKLKKNLQIYGEEIKPLNLSFSNKSKDACQKISFLKIEIKKDIKKYNDYLENYFKDLEINKNNFFTDISNYVSYELGQPTHCYDASKIKNEIILEELNEACSFKTLLDKTITLNPSDLVFKNNNKIINLAGVVGGSNTKCNSNTRCVLVECANFLPKSIIGRSTKYDINSEAAHKFERGLDINFQETVLRRFIQIVKDHAEVNSVQLFSKSYVKNNIKTLDYNLVKVNEILGTEIKDEYFKECLLSLGFNIKHNIEIPSYRNDISTQNDIAEEVARIIGYDNIKSKKLSIHSSFKAKESNKEDKIKNFLIDNDFYEVINFPFTLDKYQDSITVDNPLDSNKKFLRTSLKQSLLENLLYNEKRQQDSIKLFEISDVYLSNQNKKFTKLKKLGIIASGRVGKNYRDFAKQIDKSFFTNLFKSLSENNEIHAEEIERKNFKSKKKTPIFFIEMNINDFPDEVDDFKENFSIPSKFTKYIPISEFPSITRDLSFSITKSSSILKLQHQMNNYKFKIVKDIFIFDYFNNVKNNEIKIGYRFVFQDNSKTLTDMEVDKFIEEIIKESLKIGGISVPGYNL